MSRVYAQQKRPGVKAAEPSYRAPAAHSPSLTLGSSSSDLDAMMQAKFQQHFLDNQIPTAEAEADRIAASVSGARTPEEVKSQLGEKMGADFSNVTFHTDSAALKQADAMGARAYTSGSDVYFGSGGFDPGVAAHELVHTVQQGMVGSTMATTSAPTGGVQMVPRSEQYYSNQNTNYITHFLKLKKDAPEKMLQQMLDMRLFLNSTEANNPHASDDKYRQIRNLYQSLLTMTNSKEFAAQMSAHVSNISSTYMNSVNGQTTEQMRGNADVHKFSAISGLYNDIMGKNRSNLDDEVENTLNAAMDTDEYNAAYDHYSENICSDGVFSMKKLVNRNAYLNYRLPTLDGQPEPGPDAAPAPQPTVQPANRKAVTSEQDQKDRAEAKEIMSEITKDHSVDLSKMNGKSMLKNAKGLQYLSQQFKNIHLRKIKSSGRIGSNTRMAAGIFDRNITINPNHYSSQKDSADPSKLVWKPTPNSSKAGNYTLSHEAGHIINYQIADRLNQDNGSTKKRRNRLYCSGFNSSNHDAVARILLAEAMLKQARANNDHSKGLQELLIQHTGLKNMDEFDIRDRGDNTYVNKKKLADALKKTGEGSLLSALNDKGFTSAYGATHADEMYAEAFGEHVRNHTKRNGDHRKQHNTSGPSNLLSDEIVSLSKDVYDDNQGARSRLYAHYGNDKKTSFWTALKRKLFGD